MVHKENLYGEYKVAAKVLQESGLAEHPSARPSSVKVSTPGTADMTFNPGSGWAKAEKKGVVMGNDKWRLVRRRRRHGHI